MKRSITDSKQDGDISKAVALKRRKVDILWSILGVKKVSLLFSKPTNLPSKHKRLSLYNYDTEKDLKYSVPQPQQQSYFMTLPVEMIVHIMSFLSLEELELTLSVCNNLSVLVRHTVLEDLLCSRCKILLDQNHALLSRMLLNQNLHISVLKRLVAFYQGQLSVPLQEIEDLRTTQTSLFEKEKEYCTQRDNLQKELNLFSKKFRKYITVERLEMLLK